MSTVNDHFICTIPIMGPTESMIYIFFMLVKKSEQLLVSEGEPLCGSWMGDYHVWHIYVCIVLFIICSSIKKNMNGLSALNKTGIQKLDMMQKLISGKKTIPCMYCCALSHPANT